MFPRSRTFINLQKNIIHAYGGEGLILPILQQWMYTERAK